MTKASTSPLSITRYARPKNHVKSNRVGISSSPTLLSSSGLRHHQASTTTILVIRAGRNTHRPKFDAPSGLDRPEGLEQPDLGQLDLGESVMEGFGFYTLVVQTSRASCFPLASFISSLGPQSSGLVISSSSLCLGLVISSLSPRSSPPRYFLLESSSFCPRYVFLESSFPWPCYLFFEPLCCLGLVFSSSSPRFPSLVISSSSLYPSVLVISSLSPLVVLDFCMGGPPVGDWSSSDYSVPSSPPYTTRQLPQKIRGKMPRRNKVSSSGETTFPSPAMVSSEALAVISGTGSSLTEDAVRKLAIDIALPGEYDWVVPSPNQSANNPPPGYLTVYSTQLTLGLRFPFHDPLIQVFNRLGIPPSQLLPNSYRLIVGFLLCAQLYEFDPSVENFLGVFSPKITSGECFFYLSPRPGLTFIRDEPSSHGAWKSKYFFLKKEGWQVPLSWGTSLNTLPSLNLGEIKRRMKDAGLVDHEFSAKTLLEDELLVVAGLHPAPDTYEGPLDRFSRLRIMMNRAAVRKFIPEDVPTIPTSSGLRPVLPDDLPDDLVPPVGTPSSHAPCWYSLVLTASFEPLPVPQVNPCPFPQGTPIIEVGTYEENTPSQTPSDLPPMSPLPPPVEALSSSLKRPRLEETPSEGTHRSYEETPGLIFPTPVLTPRLDLRAGSSNMCQATHHSDVETLSLRSMQEKYMVLMKNWEALRKELADTRARMDCLQNQYRDDGAPSREREAKLVDELEALRVQIVEKDGQVAALTLENEVVRASTVQAYTRRREEGASSAVAALKNSHEYAVELSRHGFFLLH
ncbi:hypothetical protein Salat_0496200 [Sesamum alatum]|uniref:Uncharacterized protein n=1 Tax=Sesamum alatum TaxID=300844 RepID=A0AAE1Z541_9LAMI|nr:hypothetical protein Salat_0496200 [Sesamum alatum]